LALLQGFSFRRLTYPGGTLRICLDPKQRPAFIWVIGVWKAFACYG
jgi:hypothetical protein